MCVCALLERPKKISLNWNLSGLVSAFVSGSGGAVAKRAGSCSQRQFNFSF